MMTPKPSYEDLEQRIKILEQQVNDATQCQLSLAASEQRYRTLLDFAPYPVATFTLKGTASYVNPAFTRVFGWSLEEMKTGRACFVPPELAPETSRKLEELFRERTVTRYVTRRLAKDGRVLDVIARGAVFTESEMGVPGELVIFRDITREKRIARTNGAMLRISLALPEHPDLEGLLDYISLEIKRLLNTQGALVILLDEDKGEFFFPGAAHDDCQTKDRVKEIRLPVDAMASGGVLRTGHAMIVNDARKDARRYTLRDAAFGYAFDNYVLVPIKTGDRIIGVLAAFNKIQGRFDTPDMERLEMIAGTVGLSIENARFADALKRSHRDLASLDRAKTKAINHLSHELKTPVAVFRGTLNILEKQLAHLPQKGWQRAMDRAWRNLDRIRSLQAEVNDIILGNGPGTGPLFLNLVDQFADLMESSLESESQDPELLDRVRQRIQAVFQVRDRRADPIVPDRFIAQRLNRLSPRFSHRDLEIVPSLARCPALLIPLDVLEKTVDGLIRNAVENTPDQGKIEVSLWCGDSDVTLTVRDFGVGIPSDQQPRIFDGFFTTCETADYASGTAFDFNAGGRGADLLRMKIFSKQYRFSLHMTSRRCRFIPAGSDRCPGRISDCSFCRERTDCLESGGSAFSVRFRAIPPVSSSG